MDFAQLKKNRESFKKKLHTDVEKLASKTDYIDKRFWKLGTDKSGSGNAVIRFLSPKDPATEDYFVKYFIHQFKGSGGWFWQNCPTTLGKDTCPACSANNELWNTEIEANKDIARKRKRKLKYISNILVVKDPKNPDNNGKVFLFEYGAKIYAKINELINPIIDGEESINPFDFWEGADFQLIAVKGEGGFPNYDSSKFSAPKALYKGDDKQIEAVWAQVHNLKEFIDPTKFLDEKELIAKFNKAVGNVATGSPKNIEELADAKPVGRVRAPKEEPVVEPADDTADDSGDDILAEFASLASDD